MGLFGFGIQENKEVLEQKKAGRFSQCQNKDMDVHSGYHSRNSTYYMDSKVLWCT